MFKLLNKRRLFRKLVKAIGECPNREVGVWALKTMHALEQAKGGNAAIHFAALLVAGGSLEAGRPKALNYLTHTLEQLEADEQPRV